MNFLNPSFMACDMAARSFTTRRWIAEVVEAAKVVAFINEKEGQGRGRLKCERQKEEKKYQRESRFTNDDYVYTLRRS